MNSDRKHLFKNRNRGLDVRLSCLRRPWTKAGHIALLANGKCEILVSRDNPFGLWNLVEHNPTNWKGGWA
jgi:hypothetical protein